MLMHTCTHNLLEISLIRQAFSKLPLTLARHYWRALHIASTFALQHRPFLFMNTSPYGNSFLILTCTQSGEPIAAGKLYLCCNWCCARAPWARLHLFLNTDSRSETNICFFYRFDDLAWCIIIDSKFLREEEISLMLIVSKEKRGNRKAWWVNWLNFQRFDCRIGIFCDPVVSFSLSQASWLKVAFPSLAMSISVRGNICKARYYGNRRFI